MVRTPDKKAEIIETLSKCDDIPDPKQHYESLIKKRELFQNDKEKESIKTILEAFGSSDRLLILDVLMEKDRCVCELEAIMDKAQASVSHHIKILQDAGLIRGWKKGKFTHYSLVRSQFQQFQDLFTRWVNTTSNWFGEV
jgi:ArsR family transcriptional regulator